MPGSPSLFFALAILFAAGWLHLASGETCVVSNEKFDIEFVLNQDATYSYVEFVDKLKNELMPSLVYEIEGQYPGSRFGLTTFGDWYNRTGDKRDECYRLYSSLTDNSTDFLRNVRNIEMGDGGDPPESSLIGMALSVTDPQVGWSTQRVDHFGKRIVKVLAMATDSESLMPSDVTFGRPFQGYNDSCGSRPPTPEQVGKVFGTQDVFFLGLISNSTVKTIWEDYFHRMNTKGVIHALELATPEGLVDAVMDGIKEIVCSDDGITAGGDIVNGRGPGVIIVGASVGAVSLIGIAGGGAYYMYGGRREEEQELNQDEEGNVGLDQAPLVEVEADTDDFS